MTLLNVHYIKVKYRFLFVTGQLIFSYEISLRNLGLIGNIKMNQYLIDLSRAPITIRVQFLLRNKQR